MRTWKAFLGTAAALTAADQIAKALALRYLKPIGNVVLLPGLLDFTFVENRGAAFGILQGKQWVFLILTAVIIAAVLVAFVKMPRQPVYFQIRTWLSVLLAGALGNAIDRALRGYVVDFMEMTFISFPVFNVADICVVFSTIGLLILLLFFVKEEK